MIFVRRRGEAMDMNPRTVAVECSSLPISVPKFMAPTTQLLRSAEALTMPRVQVIVLNANMRCLECRDRVSKVLSEMDDLLNYVVDAAQKKVTVRGRVNPKKRMQRIRLFANDKKRKTIDQFEGLGSVGYSRSDNSLQRHECCINRWKKAPADLIKETCCFCCASY